MIAARRAPVVPVTGFLPTYHHGTRNHCPSCNASNWLIGRGSAECACCGIALPLAAPTPSTPLPPSTSQKGN